MSFIHPKNSVALQDAQSSCHFSMMREFHDITPSTYERILHRLECKLFGYHPKVRTDDFPAGHHHPRLCARSSRRQRAKPPPAIPQDQCFYWPGWGGSIDCVQFTGSADRRFTGPDRKSTILQPANHGTGAPVPSRRSGRCRKLPACTYQGQGKIRFVILIELTRKTRKEMVDTSLLKAGPEPGGGVDHLGEPKGGPSDTWELSRAQPFLGNKRAAQDRDDNDAAPGITKKPRTSSPPSQSPTLPLLPPPALYSRATVAVLTTSVINHPKLKGNKLRTMDTLIDAAECWPSMLVQDVCFGFSWDDMHMKNYPEELRDCRFTVRFDWLNETLQRKFGVFQGFPGVEDDSGDMVYEVGNEPDSEDAAMERERMSAVEAKVDSGRVESDDGWKLGSE
ncbi:hypothetical protein Q9L58_009794 [Maublancomyces gigas]|uniref:Uncharacterized protein n=1 Tax=Discina gigas TaxID=1032678 RepID=A0ABR3G5V6_9PEZI